MRNHSSEHGTELMAEKTASLSILSPCREDSITFDFIRMVSAQVNLTFNLVT